MHHVLGRSTDTSCERVHINGPCLEPEYVKEMVNKQLDAGIKKLVKEGGSKRL